MFEVALIMNKKYVHYFVRNIHDRLLFGRNAVVVKKEEYGCSQYSFTSLIAL